MTTPSLEEASGLFRSRQHAAALTEIALVVETNPSEYEPNYALGVLQLANGAPHDALRTFRIAHRLRREAADPVRGMCHALLAMGEVEKAIRLVEQYLTNPVYGTVGVLMSLAGAYAAAQRIEPLRRLLQQVEAMAQMDNEEAARLGRLRFELGDLTELANLRDLSNGAVREVLSGYAEELQGDLPAAVAHYDRATERWESWERRSVLVLQDDPERALDFARAAAALASYPEIRLAEAMAMIRTRSAGGHEALGGLASHPGLRAHTRLTARSVLDQCGTS